MEETSLAGYPPTRSWEKLLRPVAERVTNDPPEYDVTIADGADSDSAELLTTRVSVILAKPCG